MKKLEEAVRSVEMPGLLWGAGTPSLLYPYYVSLWLRFLIYLCLVITVAAKLVPVGYGIKKLTIMMTIVDDLVSVDTIIEDHLTVEPINEYVQSCDIVAFNKI